MDDSPVSIGQRLYDLAEQGNEKELRALLVQASSDDLSFQHIHSGATVLMIAAEKGHTEVVEALLEYNVDINMRDLFKRTALMLAAIYGHIEIVQKIIQHCNTADTCINMQDSHCGPALLMAVWSGRIEMVQLLLQHTTDVNIKDECGITALTIAAKHGHIQIVQALLQRNADVNIQGSEGRTALMMASMNGQHKVVQVLLQCCDIDVNLQDYKGNTAIMIALNFSSNVIELLIEAGADLTLENKDGHTWLDLNNHSVCGDKFKCVMEIHQAVAEGDKKTVQKLLLSNIFDSFYLFHCKIKVEGTQMTALSVAAWKGYTEIVDILLQHSPSITGKQQGTSSLRLAAEAGHCEVLKVLVQAGADWRAKDKDGRSALDIARSDEARAFLQLCDDCKHLTDRCERVILLRDLAEKRKLFDSLSLTNPDWSDIAQIGQHLQALKEKCVWLSVSESDYGEQLDVLRSEVSAFCRKLRKLRNENLLFLFPLVGKYHDQLKSINFSNGSLNDLEADVSAVEEGFDREELEELKNNCEIMFKQISSKGCEYMSLYKGVQYVKAGLAMEEEKEEEDINYSLLAMLLEKIKSITRQLKAFSEHDYLSLPEQCAELQQSLHNICYQLVNAKQFKELAILAQYKQQLTNTTLEVELPVLEELRSFEGQCQALLQESISDRERPQLYTRKYQLEFELLNAPEEADRMQLEAALRDIDRKISELPLYNPTPLPVRLSALKEAILSYQAQFSEYVYPTDMLSSCLDTLNRVDLSYLSPDSAVASNLPSVVSGGFDQAAEIDEQLQEGKSEEEDIDSVLTNPSCLLSTSQVSTVTHRL